MTSSGLRKSSTNLWPIHGRGGAKPTNVSSGFVTRNNHIVQDLVGHDVIADWFKIARQNTVDRNALLYLNENKVISDPAEGDVTHRMRQFESEVRLLLQNDAPISALGFQSRFGKQTPPETIYRRLQYFEKLNLPIAATEFEMKDTIGDELDKAAMTERVMTVLFSQSAAALGREAMGKDQL